MARTPRPLYMIAFGGFSDFDSLISSGDVDAMKSMAAQSEKWFHDPENAKDPQAAEERERLQQIKKEIERLEARKLHTSVA